MPNDVNVRDITQVTVLDDTTDASALVEKNGTLYKAPYGVGSGSGMDIAAVVKVSDPSTPTMATFNSILTYNEIKEKIANEEPLLVQVIFEANMQGMTMFINSAMTQYLQVPTEMLSMLGLVDVDEAVAIVVTDQMTEAEVIIGLYDDDGTLAYTCVTTGD